MTRTNSQIKGGPSRVVWSTTAHSQPKGRITGHSAALTNSLRYTAPDRTFADQAASAFVAWGPPDSRVLGNIIDRVVAWSRLEHQSGVEVRSAAVPRELRPIWQASGTDP
jgi:hypothetical protein